jgi:hypothetical protein
MYIQDLKIASIQNTIEIKSLDLKDLHLNLILPIAGYMSQGELPVPVFLL